VESGKLKWWHVRWKGLGLAILIAFGSLWLFAFAWRLFEYEWEPWFMSRWMLRNEPYLAIVPKPVSGGLTSLPGKRLECFGLSFEFPWTTVDFERKTAYGCAQSSKSGGSVLFFNPDASFDAAHMSRGAANAWRLTDPRSDYDLWLAAMETTPNDVKWWKIAQQNARSYDLLLLKSEMIHEGNALYFANFGEMRGFQDGDPSSRPYTVQLDLFDRNDQHYMVHIGSGDEHHPVISQTEINAMISSMRLAVEPAGAQQ
jgi:hypothetical protein